MARNFFNNLPNTTTPLTAPRLNGLLDGDEAMGNIVVDSIKNKNLFNKNNVFVGYLYADGTISTDQTCRYSDYIPIENVNKITLSGINTSGGGNLIEYNSNKELIDYWGTSNRTITLNSNTKFVRFSIKATDLNTTQLEYGDTTTDYAPYQGIGYVSGSNENGRYIKYDDGTLICYSSKSVQTEITTQWGSMYESPAINLGALPESFIQTPIINATVNYSSAFLEKTFNTSTTSWGDIVLCRPVQTSGTFTYYIDLIAIGRWK